MLVTPQSRSVHSNAAPLAVLVACVLAARCALAADDAKLPVPDQAAQEQALALVRDVYKEDFAAAAKPRDKAALAKKLLAEGIATAGDPAGQYVLLSEARRYGVETGEIATALEAIDRLADAFQVVATKMRVSTLDDLTKAASTPAKAKQLTEIVQALIDEALGRDDFDGADELLPVAAAAAKKSKYTGLVKDVAARTEQLARLRAAHEAVGAALAKLEKDPANAEANLAVGRHACFVKGDWESGLPMLALGGDERLKSLATVELAAPQDVQKQFDLADGWWSLADDYEGTQQASIRRHAVAWYEQVLPELTGLAKAKATKRIKQMGREIPRDVVARPANKDVANDPVAPRTPRRQSRREVAPQLENSIGMKLQLIPAGSFIMGSPPHEKDRSASETQHKVKLTRAFYLGALEVTQEQYQRAMGTNPSLDQSSIHPVQRVSWNEAQEFCERLSALPEEKAARRTYRLPTEAEWEYACRAGSPWAYSTGDDERQLAETQLYQMGLNPVGFTKPNRWGLYDMHGNLGEWCLDWFGEYPAGTVTNPHGPPDGTDRVHRGYVSAGQPRAARSAHRESSPPDYRDRFLGFRVASDLDTVKVAAKAPVAQASARPQAAGGGKRDLTNSLGMVLRPIAPGRFIMGVPTEEKEPDPFTRPHKVTLTKGFYLGAHEVTQQQYERLMGTNPSQFRATENPVEQVSWDDAVEFCARLSALPAEQAAGRSYRLPTEAEWEYACRAGSQAAFCFGDDEQQLGDYAWILSNSSQIPQAVGLRKPNAWGIYDMHGNVQEWCQDRFGVYPAGDGTDPQGDTKQRHRSYRGGFYECAPKQCRSDCRFFGPTSTRFKYLGFRVACDLAGQVQK